MKTQWRHGFNGREGLDYGPAIRLIDARGYDLEFALELLQVIEIEVLEQIAARRDKSNE